MANPTSGATPTYDGFGGKAWVSGNPGTGAGDASVLAEWVVAEDGQGGGAAFVYDLVPSVNFATERDTLDQWTLLATEAKYQDGVGHDTTNTNLCVE